MIFTSWTVPSPVTIFHTCPLWCFLRTVFGSTCSSLPLWCRLCCGWHQGIRSHTPSLPPHHYVFGWEESVVKPFPSWPWRLGGTKMKIFQNWNPPPPPCTGSARGTFLDRLWMLWNSRGQRERAPTDQKDWDKQWKWPRKIIKKGQAIQKNTYSIFFLKITTTTRNMRQQSGLGWRCRL